MTAHTHDPAAVERIAEALYDHEFGEGRWDADAVYEKDPEDYYSEPYVNFRNDAREAAWKVRCIVRDLLLNDDVMLAVRDSGLSIPTDRGLHYVTSPEHAVTAALEAAGFLDDGRPANE